MEEDSMKMSKLIGVSLATVMALSLAACGGGASDGGSAAPTSGGAAQGASEEGGTSLTIWQPTDTAAIEAWWVSWQSGMRSIRSFR